ncbi:hypothetical protein OGAPHI_003466 [Ogataea philodendri]|uniref:Cytochrome b-c1 complex subunit 2, mitochondrial n=2 Tax=Saccharomycotina TaxID=147537 RepID=A0A9P8T5V7_9ASCO|nr:uncharacterized protein OGAPHI_003466 [Ogataea philodendri]KAH3666470.1 hypothetical protein OGAPHI_003466 [Ogataea philodendri]
MFAKTSIRSFSTTAPKAVKVSTVGTPGTGVSSLKVIVKNAGSKTSAPGLAHLLASSSFLNTNARSGLRLKRESELLGGEYKATVTRDSLVLEAKFLKEALPYFVDAIGDVVAGTAFRPHEFSELALPYAKHETALKSTSDFKALEALHAITFRTGLGKPLYYDGSKSYTSEDVAKYAKSVFLEGNIEVIGTDVVEADLNKFVAESALSKLPAGETPVAKQSSVVGQDARIRQAGPTSAAIGVPVSDVATFSVLAAYVKASLPTSATASVSAEVATYNGASLFYVLISSASGAETGALVTETAKLIKEAKDLSKFKALATYNELANGSTVDVSAAKASVSVPKFNLAVAGDVDTVPYADEL